MLRYKGWRRQRKRLSRRRDFAWNVAFRHRPLFHRKHGNAGIAIENIEESRLIALNYDWVFLPIVHDGGEQRRRSCVEVPEIVVNQLEAPNQFAGLRAQSDHRISPLVIA